MSVAVADSQPPSEPAKWENASCRKGAGEPKGSSSKKSNPSLPLRSISFASERTQRHFALFAAAFLLAHATARLLRSDRSSLRTFPFSFL